MRCKYCDSDTRVVVTRQPEPDIIRRNRTCSNGHKFVTWESLHDPRVIKGERARKNRNQKNWLKNNPEKAKSLWKRSRMREQARKEAKETGEDVNAIYERYGVL